MYSSRITRNNRGAFIVLCDRSGSMAEEVLFEGEMTTKADAVARTINMFVDEVLNRCRREEGVRDYFDIAIIEYGGNGVVPLIPRGEGFISITELAKMPVENKTIHRLRRLPNGNQVSVALHRREWIAPKAFGDTPMGAALAEAGRLAAKWCSRPANRNSFPPVVLNITDGEASDADSMELCGRAYNIKNTATADGNTLLINIHLARRDETGPAISFPRTPDELPPHPYARLLWEMSSCMPVCCNGAISGRAGAGNVAGARIGTDHGSMARTKACSRAEVMTGARDETRDETRDGAETGVMTGNISTGAGMGAVTEISMGAVTGTGMGAVAETGMRAVVETGMGAVTGTSMQTGTGTETGTGTGSTAWINPERTVGKTADREMGIETPPFRAMSYNCAVNELFAMLTIGSVSGMTEFV